MNNFDFIYSQAPQEISFPDSKNENWRYINLGPLKEKLNNSTEIDKPHSIFKNQTIDSHLIVNDDSIYVNKSLPKGISINIIELEKVHYLDPRLKNKIGKIAKIDDYFVSENTKKFNQLIVINIGKKADLKTVLNLDIKVSSNIDLKPRFLFYSEKKSSSCIQITCQNNQAIINGVFEFYLEDKSSIDLISLNNSKDSIEILNYWFEISQSASLKATFISLGELQTLKNDIRVDLIDKNASADIGGLYIPKPNSVVDYNIKMNHLSKNTRSNQFFRGILDKYSKASFTGLVKIEKNCINSRSEQVNNNLLLSEKAQIKSDPQLEIYCNDVECSHGSTIGQFDEETLFYLCSRGIHREDAKKMLMEAFYIDILNRINDSSIQEMVEESIL